MASLSSVGIKIVFMVIAASLRFRNSSKADRKVTDGIPSQDEIGPA
jgi:hypothetical protein